MAIQQKLPPPVLLFSDFAAWITKNMKIYLSKFTYRITKAFSVDQTYNYKNQDQMIEIVNWTQV